MKFETKFSVDDVAYTLINDRIYECRIKGINIISNGGTLINYDIVYYDAEHFKEQKCERQLFRTKEGLVDYLLDNIGWYEDENELV